MFIKCEIDDLGEDVYAKCRRCGNRTSGFSIAHCLVRMHQTCRGGVRHRYIEYDGVPDERERFEPKYHGDPACIFTAEGLELHLRIKAAYNRILRERQQQGR